MDGEERLSAVDILPLELWTEVLARLSVKDLIQFRCVCKFWLTLIDSQNFISKHLHLCKSNHENKLLCVSRNGLGYGFINTSLSLTRYDAYKLADYEEIIRLPFKRYFVQFRGYVNGLILLIRSLYGRELSSQGELLLWNPLIRKALVLPSYPVNQFSKVLLGFDPSSNDYKVVVFGDIKSQAREAAIYKLSMGSWHSTIYYIKGVDLLFTTAVFSKGATHSLAADNRPEYHTTIEKSLRISLVASFDFSQETFHYRDLPCKVGYFGAPVQGVLFVMDDSLAFFHISQTEFCIWLTQERDGNELWTKWYTGGPCLNMHHTLRKSLFPRIIYVKSMTLLAIHENKVSVFDVQSRERNLLLPRTSAVGVDLMDAYVETLVLLSHKHGRPDTDIL